MTGSIKLGEHVLILSAGSSSPTDKESYQAACDALTTKKASPSPIDAEIQFLKQWISNHVLFDGEAPIAQFTEMPAEPAEPIRLVHKTDEPIFIPKNTVLGNPTTVHDAGQDQLNQGMSTGEIHDLKVDEPEVKPLTPEQIAAARAQIAADIKP